MLSLARCVPLLPRHVRFASGIITAPRRGRNLTERYRTLERTTGSKSNRAAQVSLLSQGSASAAELRADTFVSTSRTSTPKTIAGFAIPEEPRAPADDECCMSGCAVCVYDLYEEALAAYKESVTTLRVALTALHIPEAQWPAHIRTNPTKDTHTASTTGKSKDAVLSAFEEMERALQVKREKRATVEAEKRARGDVLTGDGEQMRLDLRGVYEGIKWVIFPNH